MSIFCKVGAPGYIASVVFGIVVSVAIACVIPTIDKVIYYKGEMDHSLICDAQLNAYTVLVTFTTVQHFHKHAP